MRRALAASSSLKQRMAGILTLLSDTNLANTPRHLDALRGTLSVLVCLFVKLQSGLSKG
jgi:hypothetical protein